MLLVHPLLNFMVRLLLLLRLLVLSLSMLVLVTVSRRLLLLLFRSFRLAGETGLA
jgi:hypothetical protein